MTLDLWVQIGCAVVPTIVTIALTAYLAVRDHKHDKRIDGIAEEQRQIENLRHRDNTDAAARTFIHKYHAKRGLIPLCAIASMYDNVRQYNRDMYNDFCCLTTEAQNKVLECLELDLRVMNIDNIYLTCYDALVRTAREKLHDDYGLYEGGKYIYRALQNHASKSFPEKHTERQSYITDVLASCALGEYHGTPIQHLWNYYNAGISNEHKCCYLMNTIVGYIAIYFGISPESQNKDYGTPGVLGPDSELETMEDLFLWSVFYMYTYLVIPSRKDNSETALVKAKHKIWHKIKKAFNQTSSLDVCREALLWILRTVYLTMAVYTIAFVGLGILSFVQINISTGIVSFILAGIGCIAIVILQLLCSGIKKENSANLINTFAVIGTMIALIELIIKFTNGLISIAGV